MLIHEQPTPQGPQPPHEAQVDEEPIIGSVIMGDGSEAPYTQAEFEEAYLAAGGDPFGRRPHSDDPFDAEAVEAAKDHLREEKGRETAKDATAGIIDDFLSGSSSPFIR